MVLPEALVERRVHIGQDELATLDVCRFLPLPDAPSDDFIAS